MTRFVQAVTEPQTPVAALLVIACLLAAGCSPAGSSTPGPSAIEGLGLQTFTKPSTASDDVLVGPVPLQVSAVASSVVSVRSTIRSGAFELVVHLDGAEFSRRRVERIGENLTIIPLPAANAASMTVVHAPNTGPLDADLLNADIENANPDQAAAVAADRASRFEAETGQLADPLVENLVPNASFAADDEVRGTPADWFAYVETSADTLERSLRVSGVAPGKRPYLSTAPMRVEPGRRYRILVRIAVREGTVDVRVADYEELGTIADVGRASRDDGLVEMKAEFTASSPDRAARIRFEPAVAGDRTDFTLSAVQMELLP